MVWKVLAVQKVLCSIFISKLQGHKKVGKCLVMLSLICDLHAFIQQVPLLELGCQKFSIGLGKTKVSDQVVDVFLVREVRPSLLNRICETVIWISSIFLAV